MYAETKLAFHENGFNFVNLVTQFWVIVIPFDFGDRAEELETALMEMVKQDNRRQLSARVNFSNCKVNTCYS